mmetsp:Transcript_23862/g.28840  ORF Transcript_23862/g.28840 Transcript_23862/m.28840 type:complete len:448 (+) Transcript_23862:159-1502(+)|eukprot:CAMPEP_0197850160 /NCGR_PEP_ID=MMETSP1438-20131217/14432_1 /TAXON_ID=1461541 /ORGANISM="Pterosperma sp., Strain CCMP1384" /LENGTH=447 /DNA_ID=CAMNT_0043463163 /DNA_START=157 /DNA_END=1500 /DNA_ORIENTATION=-
MSVNPSSDSVYWAFARMAACFSFNHACVTTVLSLASSELGKDLGGYSSGTLYCFYTLIALFGATAIVDTLGSKQALVAGCAAYCVYVATFLVSAALPAIKWPVCLGGSVIGGCAAGWLWTAQGEYFTVSAELHAEGILREHEENQALLYASADQETRDQRFAEEKGRSTAKLAALFSSIYLGGELVLGLASYFLLKSSWGKTLCFAAFTVAAVASAFGMLILIPKLPSKADDLTQDEKPSALQKSLKGINLLLSDPKMILMYPVQMTFGFTSSFMVYYVTKDVITNHLGEAYIPLLRCVVSGVAAAGSIPTAHLTKYLGKLPLMITGMLCFLTFAAVFTFAPMASVAKFSAVVPLFIVYGYGRCTFEGLNKAVMCDFFPQGAAWGANVIVASGAASSIGFFVFPNLEKAEMGTVCMAIACCAIVCYPIAQAIHLKKDGHVSTIDVQK